MPRDHWFLVLNGKSADEDDVRAAVASMRRAGVRIDVRVTWEAGDATRFVVEAIAAGVDAVIAAGGDGTMGEVADALARHGAEAAQLPALGALPIGTANDFASAAGIPDVPLDALRLVAASTARPVDLLRIEADGDVRWALNFASGGFGTRVTVETHEGLKKMLGGLAYVITGLARLGRVEPETAAFRGDGFAWDGAFIALGIGNGRQAGGGQALCPQASIDDGLLDLTIVPPLDGTVAATLGAVVTEGKDAALERVAVQVRLPSLGIRSPAPLTLNIDGEPVAASRFRIDCIGGRVRMHLPPDCPLLTGGAARPGVDAPVGDD